MRALALVTACAACAAAPVSKTSTKLTTAPAEPAPADIAEHQHADRAHADDPTKLYVEVTSDADHGDVLRRSATTGLANVAYAVAVADGGDVELHAELASLTPATCHVKIYVLRLPQHDLLAIADGSAHADRASADACLSAVGTAVVRDKVPAVLDRQLAAKR
jgi:hypothetical protein